MKDYRRIMRNLEFDKLVEFAAAALSIADTSPPVSTEQELKGLSREEIIDLVKEYALEDFANSLEMQDEGSSSMHPDEDDEEFAEHEDLDDD